MKRTQPDTIGQRYSADAVDAKSCKAEETKERIRMETDGDDRPRQSDADECKRYVGNTRTQIDVFKTKRAIKIRHTDESK